MRLDLHNVPSAQAMHDQILHHLTHSQGRGAEFATPFDWRMAVSFAVLLIGATLPKTYSTSAMLVVDVTNIIEPLMKGQAEVTKIDRSEQARDVIYTRGIMEAVGKELKRITKETSPEQQDKIIKSLRGGLEIKPEKNNYFK